MGTRRNRPSSGVMVVLSNPRSLRARVVAIHTHVDRHALLTGLVGPRRGGHASDVMCLDPDFLVTIFTVTCSPLAPFGNPIAASSWGAANPSVAIRGKTPCRVT
jgi:hypothetical protein